MPTHAQRPNPPAGDELLVRYLYLREERSHHPIEDLPPGLRARVHVLAGMIQFLNSERGEVARRSSDRAA